jgi:hypothetical protein
MISTLKKLVNKYWVCFDLQIYTYFERLFACIQTFELNFLFNNAKFPWLLKNYYNIDRNIL